MLTKSTVQKQLEKLPEKFTLDDLVEKLIIIEKIEKGLKDSEENKVITEQDLDNETDKWLNLIL